MSLPHPIIERIVNRDCHVSRTNMQVIRHVIGRLKHGRKSFLKLSHPQRKQFLKDCIACHKRNQQEYALLMSGKFYCAPGNMF